MSKQECIQDIKRILVEEPLTFDAAVDTIVEKYINYKGK